MATKSMRSPRYPVIGLREAIDRVTTVYRKDNRNKIPKSLVAEHMGYQGLNGKSLGIIAAVSKYGLLEGGADAMWVTPLAVEIIEREPNDPERIAALIEAGGKVDLYNEIEAQFPTKASDAAIRSYLVTKRAFLPDSAERLIRSYRETRELVDALPQAYDPAPNEAEQKMNTVLEPDAEVQTPPLRPSAVSSDINLAVGEREWLRGPLSRDSRYRLVVSGEMGPKEIGKLIKLLQAQKDVLDDDDFDDLMS